jgi:hypothetical protein
MILSIGLRVTMIATLGCFLELRRGFRPRFGAIPVPIAIGRKDENLTNCLRIDDKPAI